VLAANQQLMCQRSRLSPFGDNPISSVSIFTASTILEIRFLADFLGIYREFRRIAQYLGKK
jgi:hypothetical protein